MTKRMAPEYAPLHGAFGSFPKAEGKAVDFDTGRELTDEEAAQVGTDIDTDHIAFTSGRTIYANNGIVGLSPDGEVSQGYDGGIDDDLTPGEQHELADLMIKRWLAFKANLPAVTEASEWRCPVCKRLSCAPDTMCIYSPPGTYIVYLGTNGHEWERKEGNAKLTPLTTAYRVDLIEIESWFSRVRLEGVDGWFNTVMFGRMSELRPGNQWGSDGPK